ncbi:MAG: hypothetical protein ACI8TV_001181 [Porticoccaceae bacterium]|jgi:hypothetical protein
MNTSNRLSPVQGYKPQQLYKAKSVRLGGIFYLYVIWLLSLPFYRFSVVGTYSLDNLLAPLLCFTAIAVPSIPSAGLTAHRRKTILIALAIYSVYALAITFKFINNPDIFLAKAWNMLRDSFYFLVPMLYIRDQKSYRITKSVLMIMASLAGISALLAALGIVEFEVERFAESRIGVDWLPKSIGLYSAYGDVAILFSFTVLMLVSHNKQQIRFWLGSLPAKLSIITCLLAGFAGAQSRNMLLSVLVSYLVFRVFKKIEKAPRSRRNVLIMLYGLGGTMAASLLLFLGSFISQMISGLGGEKAQHTADQRVESYDKAIELVWDSAFMGVDSVAYTRWGEMIEHLHNMWLSLLTLGGAFALFAVAGLMFYAAKGALGARAQSANPIDKSIILGVLAAMFIATQFYPGLTDTFWLMLGVLMSFHWVAADPRMRDL